MGARTQPRAGVPFRLSLNRHLPQGRIGAVGALEPRILRPVWIDDRLRHTGSPRFPSENARPPNGPFPYFFRRTSHPRRVGAGRRAPPCPPWSSGGHGGIKRGCSDRQPRRPRGANWSRPRRARAHRGGAALADRKPGHACLAVRPTVSPFAGPANQHSPVPERRKALTSEVVTAGGPRSDTACRETCDICDIASGVLSLVVSDGGAQTVTPPRAIALPAPAERFGRARETGDTECVECSPPSEWLD